MRLNNKRSRGKKKRGKPAFEMDPEKRPTLAAVHRSRRVLRANEGRAHRRALLRSDAARWRACRVVQPFSVSTSVRKSGKRTYELRPTRRRRSWKRVSERRPTNLGFTFKKMSALECSSQAFLSHAKALSLSPRPAQTRAKAYVDTYLSLAIFLSSSNSFDASFLCPDTAYAYASDPRYPGLRSEFATAFRKARIACSYFPFCS